MPRRAPSWEYPERCLCKSFIEKCCLNYYYYLLLSFYLLYLDFEFGSYLPWTIFLPLGRMEFFQSCEQQR